GHTMDRDGLWLRHYCEACGQHWSSKLPDDTPPIPQKQAAPAAASRTIPPYTGPKPVVGKDFPEEGLKYLQMVHDTAPEKLEEVLEEMVGEQLRQAAMDLMTLEAMKGLARAYHSGQFKN